MGTGPGGVTDEHMNCAGCDRLLSGRQRKWCSETCSKEGARAVRLWERYRITLGEYNKILVEQDGKCSICKRPPKAGKSLAVDHDHQTGYVRGLLCFMCNRRVLGARSADILVKTAAYVTDPPARRALGKDVIAPGRAPRKRKPRRKRKAA